MNNQYVIVSDATLDLPMKIIDEFDIKVIPMMIEIDGKEYTHYPDEREFTTEEFYRKIKEGSVSHTSQITPAAFMTYFEEILKKDKIYFISHFLQGYGTYHSALIAIEELKEEYPERKMYCIDSLCASIGEAI